MKTLPQTLWLLVAGAIGTVGFITALACFAAKHKGLGTIKYRKGEL